MAKAVESLREQFGHTLPTSMFRFRKKVAEYKRDGYASLISGRCMCGICSCMKAVRLRWRFSISSLFFAYARKKDEDLVVECFRDMFRLIERNGGGMCRWFRR